MPECIHEIEAATCAVCTPPPRRWRPGDGWGPWFDARFCSHCAGCDAAIETGDQIRSDGAGGWLCGSCGDVYGGPRTVRVIGGLL